MERDAAMKAFSAFINEQNLNADQIAFVMKVIDYIEQNGLWIMLLNLPGLHLTNHKASLNCSMLLQKKLVQIINEVKDNALKIIISHHNLVRRRSPKDDEGLFSYTYTLGRSLIAESV